MCSFIEVLLKAQMMSGVFLLGVLTNDPTVTVVATVEVYHLVVVLVDGS
jgi:hypothetical protein